MTRKELLFNIEKELLRNRGKDVIDNKFDLHVFMESELLMDSKNIKYIFKIAEYVAALTTHKMLLSIENILLNEGETYENFQI